MEQSLFEKYGGFATVHKVVEHFYDGVLDNDMLSPHFESVDMSRLIDHQTRFFASAMGGPASFDDSHLEKTHQGLGITEEAWDAVVEVRFDSQLVGVNALIAGKRFQMTPSISSGMITSWTCAPCCGGRRIDEEYIKSCK